MYSIIVTMTVRDDRHGEFEVLIKALAAAVRANEPGNLAYGVLRSRSAGSRSGAEAQAEAETAAAASATAAGSSVAAASGTLRQWLDRALIALFLFC